MSEYHGTARRTGRRSPIGLILLCSVPVISFGLGTWQVYRRRQKLALLNRCTQRLSSEPTLLPSSITPDQVADYEYRRVLIKGIFQHSKSMLVGPRMHNGQPGSQLYVPFLLNGADMPVIVNRGWVTAQTGRPYQPVISNNTDDVIQVMVREPRRKNMFTPENHPENRLWHFPAIDEMAKWTMSRPILLEEIFAGTLAESDRRIAEGLPLGRVPSLDLRNNHLEYIFTWYSLSIATSIGLWVLLKRPPNSIQRRVQAAHEI